MHAYALFQTVIEADEPAELEERWFAWSCNASWSLAGLLASGGNHFFVKGGFLGGRRDGHKRQYLAAVRRYLEEMVAVGPRFKLLATVDVMPNLALAEPYTLLKEEGDAVRKPGLPGLQDALDNYLRTHR